MMRRFLFFVLFFCIFFTTGFAEQGTSQLSFTAPIHISAMTLSDGSIHVEGEASVENHGDVSFSLLDIGLYADEMLFSAVKEQSVDQYLTVIEPVAGDVVFPKTCSDIVLDGYSATPSQQSSLTCVVTVGADVMHGDSILVPDDVPFADGVYTLQAGQTVQLSSSMASGVWRASDYGVVQVDAARGTLTALSAGNAVVTCEDAERFDGICVQVVGGVPDDYENYYVFLDDGTGQGWQLRISESFKNAINLNGAVSYYDWYAGQPLPAFPKIHEGKPVTSLAYALSGCNTASSIDVSRWDTSGIRDMSYLFEDCAFVRTLDLSGFDTSSVVSMRGMFSGCTRLLKLDLRSFDTCLLSDASEMFADCGQLEYLNISKFDFLSLVDAHDMFARCFSLQYLDGSGFYAPVLQNTAGMFADMRDLVSLDLTGFDCNRLQSSDNMFLRCNALRHVSVHDDDSLAVLSSSSMTPESVVFEAVLFVE